MVYIVVALRGLGSRNMQMPARSLRMYTLCCAYALHKLIICSATDEAFAARFGRQFHREVRPPVQLLYMHSIHTYLYLYTYPPKFNSGPRGSRRPKASIYEARARLPLGVLPSTGSKRKVSILPTFV